MNRPEPVPSYLQRAPGLSPELARLAAKPHLSAQDRRRLDTAIAAAKNRVRLAREAWEAAHGPLPPEV